MAQLGGDPTLVAEQWVGMRPRPCCETTAVVAARQSWTHGGMENGQAGRRAPRWFEEMKRMADGQGGAPTDSCSPIELLSRLDQLGERLSCCDLTFAIVAGVSQGFSALQRLLERRTGGLATTAEQGASGLWYGH